MKKNMGSADRIIRIVIAAFLLVLYFTGIISGILGIILIALSVIFIITGFTARCPIYYPLGISTDKKIKE